MAKKKKSHLMTILGTVTLLAMATSSLIYYTWLKADSNKLGRKLDKSKKEIVDSHTILNNLEAEKAHYTERSYIMKKVIDHKLRLQDPEPGQVRFVRHYPEHPESPVSVETYQADNKGKNTDNLVSRSK